MIVRTDVDLQPLTTFRTRGARAQYLYQAEHLDDVVEIAATVLADSVDWFVLGGGSNLLLTRPIEHVIRLELRDRRIVVESADTVTIELGAGNVWHECVQWAVANGWAGIEAMALIPGTVGAAPIQNIGAYGQQLSDVCAWVEGVEIPSGQIRRLDRQQCQFDYRDSIFKRQLQRRFLITSIGLTLHKRPTATVTYAELARALGNRTAPTIEEVFASVVAIRRAKLPPDTIGSAGSFFKNPIVSSQHAALLRAEHPTMPQYPQNGAVKLSAGWLIEQCGFKGIRRGDAGVYERHALVLVNYGNADAAEILALATEIKAAVWKQFGVELEEEVVIV
ncbi:MAG: UDP-N-acetylenolpyruvoylglucosamine reductase [Candidatus Kapaibacterium sp.]|nr:MAG: UDP-N-acetylenolpyruvoylglucosamine reductase [Candidatus Kapabacteria bacterium]